MVLTSSSAGCPWRLFSGITGKADLKSALDIILAVLSWPGVVAEFCSVLSLEKILVFHASCIAESCFWEHLLLHRRAPYFFTYKSQCMFYPVWQDVACETGSQVCCCPRHHNTPWACHVHSKSLFRQGTSLSEGEV